MPPVLRPTHAPRYAKLGRLLLKHRRLLRGALDGSIPPDLAGVAGSDEAEQADAEELADELMRLGPTFIKLGQLLSTRADLLPPAHLSALSKLRDDVEPFSAEEAVATIEKELDVKVSKAFKSFDRCPVGAASLGQVHKAALRDGRPVAVKVQRPGIRQQAMEDMEVITELAVFLDSHSEGASKLGFAAMVEEFRRSLIDELDYTSEAANLRLLGDHLSGYQRIVVPQPIDDYTTTRVLTMTFVSGKSIASIGPLVRMELDCPGLADELISAYLDQILVDGFFHADPHPGNVLLTDDGRLALIDLGMVARLSPQVQEQLLGLLLAISARDGSGVTDALERLGTKHEGYDGDLLRATASDLVLRYGTSTVGRMAAGRLLGQLAAASSSAGLRPRSELTMLAKALLNLDQVARILDPQIDVDSVVQSHAAGVMRHRMLEAASPTSLMRSALEATAFAEALPGRLNQVLESLSEGKFTLSLEGLNENAVMRSAQKMANRMATGVVIAAFVVAAALFSSGKETMVWGYPLLTIVFLGLAVAVAAVVGFGVIRRDLPQRGRRTPGG